MLFCFVFLLISSRAFSSTLIHKTLCLNGQNGGGNCDYTTLNAALAGNQQNLVTGDKYLEIEILGEWATEDTTFVNYDSYTTAIVDHYIYVYTTGSARHSGKWCDTCYRKVATSTSSAMGFNRGNIIFDGVQFDKPSPTSGDANLIYQAVYITDEDSFIYKDCIFRQSGVATSQILKMFSFDSNTNNYFINCLFYDFDTSENTWTRMFALGNGADYYFYNTTFRNIHRMFMGGDSNTVVNYINVGLDTIDLTNSTSATINTTTSSTSTPTYVDADNKDFHLASGDTTWKDQGTDLSGSAVYPFSTDIDGETRTGTWDIGADEYASAGTTRNRFMIIQ